MRNNGEGVREGPRRAHNTSVLNQNETLLTTFHDELLGPTGNAQASKIQTRQSRLGSE